MRINQNPNDILNTLAITHSAVNNVMLSFNKLFLFG